MLGPQSSSGLIIENLTSYGDAEKWANYWWNRLLLIAGIGGSRAGKPFTPAGRQEVIRANKEAHGGRTTCANCGKPTTPSQQTQRGVTPQDDETNVDHKIPQSRGGEGEPSNGQVLCRACNIEKSDSMPNDVPEGTLPEQLELPFDLIDIP